MANKKMGVGEKIAIAAIVLFAVLLLYGFIKVGLLIASIIGFFSREDADDIVLAGEDVSAFLDENGFTYETDSEMAEEDDLFGCTSLEEGFLKEMTFVIRDRDATATLQLGYNYVYQVRFKLDDPYKDSEGKLYSLLPLVGSLTGRYDRVNLDEIQTDEYLYRDTEEETIYQHYINDVLTEYPNPSNYGFTYALRSDGDSYSIYDRLTEKYIYETVEPAE